MKTRDEGELVHRNDASRADVDDVCDRRRGAQTVVMLPALN